MKKTVIAIIIFGFFVLLFIPTISSAECCGSRQSDSTNCTPCLPNPLGGTTGTDVNLLIGQVINAVLGIVGSLALVMFIYGGLTWMTAAGNKEKIQKGKDILIWATIGLIIIFSAYAIVKFVLVDVLQGAPSGDQTQQTTGG